MPLEDTLGSGDVGEAGYPVPLGSYLLLHRLAKGGMGEVHLAKHGGLAGIEKYCVVKTLKRGALEDDEAVRRFMDEARVVVNLSHRNICSVFDVGRADQRYYLAMEHVAGRDLRAVVERAREKKIALPESIALHLVGEVLEALDYAHRFTHPTSGEPLHLVHRDVSPANVMVSIEGEVKLIDFGLALSREKQLRTEPHMVMGKIAYMAPEQLAAQPLDKRTDLYAAAVMLYELLVNERYYGELNDGGIVLAASTGSYVPPKLHTLDRELQAALRSALERRLATRTADCAELRQQLTRYAMRRQIGAGARELRALMETLFPEERERGRNLLARFANVSALARVDVDPSIRAPAPVVPLRRAEPEPATDLPPHFDTLESFDFETSDPSTPVGRVRLAKAKPEAVKAGTPRPELLERLGLPESGSCEASATPRLGTAPTGLDDGQELCGGAAVGHGKGPSGLALSVAALALAVVTLAVVIARAPEPALAVPRAEQAREQVPAPGADPRAAVPSDVRPAPADATTVPASAAAVEQMGLPHLTVDERIVDEAKTATTSGVGSSEPPRARPRSAEPARAKPVASDIHTVPNVKRRNSSAMSPPSSTAKPEQKIRYLQASCRQKAPCAAELVRTFREMRVDDARAFWAQVDVCVSRCAQ